MKEKVGEYYKKRSITYDDLDKPESLVASVREIGLRDHLQIMGLKEDELVLDVGCGNGRFVNEFGKKTRAVGVDFTIEMLNKASQANAFLIRADAEYLPFKEGTFDAVHTAGLLGIYCSDMICIEMARTLKKGGRMFASFPAATSVSGVFVKIFSRFGWNPSLLDHWYTEKEIINLIPSDMKVRNLYRLGFEPPFQRLFKNIRSQWLVKTFIWVERNFRDRPLIRYFSGRIFLEAEK